jgi:hypothetical protein
MGLFNKDKIKTIKYTTAQYVGGHPSYPKKKSGILIFTDTAVGIRIDAFGSTPKGAVLKWSDIASVEIGGQQVGQSRLGATLLFGEIGALAASGSKNQATVVVHTKDGQAAYYIISKKSAIEVKAQLTPLLQAVKIPFTEQLQQATPTTPIATDELEKLAKLKEQGILTDEEFTAKKKQLLGL